MLRDLLCYKTKKNAEMMYCVFSCFFLIWRKWEGGATPFKSKYCSPGAFQIMTWY